MSKNYNQYYNRNANNTKPYNQPKVEEPVKEEVVEEVKSVLPVGYETPKPINPILPEDYESPEPVETAEPAIEEAPATPITGVVSDCASLRVRKAANAEAEILGTIELGSEVAINEAESTSDFYKVCTAAGLEGFCMKKFITIK